MIIYPCWRQTTQYIMVSFVVILHDVGFYVCDCFYFYFRRICIHRRGGSGDNVGQKRSYPKLPKLNFGSIIYPRSGPNKENYIWFIKKLLDNKFCCFSILPHYFRLTWSNFLKIIKTILRFLRILFVIVSILNIRPKSKQKIKNIFLVRKNLFFFCLLPSLDILFLNKIFLLMSFVYIITQLFFFWLFSSGKE